MHRLLLASLCLLLLCAPNAEAAKQKKSKQKSESAATTYTIVTGPETGTYIEIGNDIKHAVKNQVQLDVDASDGSIENIKRLQGKNPALLGIVQSDVLGFLKRSKNEGTARAVADLRMVAPLYREEVHVLARKDIKNFSDLKGKRVVVGEEGSGNMLTAVNLLALMNVRVKDTLKLAPPEGVVEVLDGKADAVIFVGGKPVKLFKNIEALDRPENMRFSKLAENVHFIALDSPEVLKEYESTVITPLDYGFMDAPVKTVAVRSVLVSRDMSKNKKSCAAIGTLMKTLRVQLENLRKNGHPKWRDLDFSGGNGLWKRDSCA